MNLETIQFERVALMQLIARFKCVAVGSLGAMVLGVAPPLLAQQPPDAGQLIEQLRPAPQPPAPSRELGLGLPAEPAFAPGGEQVRVEALALSGNTVFSREQLLDALAQPEGHSYDLAGLQGLANALSEFYRENGFPFARAFVPPQTLDNGTLVIEIIEGRYGVLSVGGADARFIRQAQPFLGLLQTGDVIRARPLERTTLLLEDLPGIRVLPVLRPSDAVGAGDVEFILTREPVARGVVGLDNHGNRLTGYGRLKGTFAFDSPFRLGDQLVVNTLYTSERMAFAGFSYAAPLGGTGLRGNASYTRTEYQLGKEYAGEGFRGRASVYSAGLEYPLLRSQRSNITLIGNLQHKALYNEVPGNDDADYQSNVVPISLTFDHRDGLGGGGVTYGALTTSFGRVEHSSDMRASGNRVGHGDFMSVNLDLARIQSLGPNWTLFGRLSGQWSDDRLDSSEYVSLGGAERVRAFPSGEASGMKGAYAQLELRYAHGIYSPYVFVDAGATTSKAAPERRLAGAGVGLRVLQLSGFNLDSALAWRLSGEPSSDTARKQNPVFWLSATYRY